MDIQQGIEQGKERVKQQVKKQVVKAIKKVIIKIIKKLIMKLAMLIIKAIIVAFTALISVLGLPVVIILTIVIILGGAMFILAPSLGLIDSDSPISKKELRLQLETLIEESSHINAYRPPFELVTSIDQMRIIQEDLDPWQKDFNPIVKTLSPDLEYKTYQNTYQIKTVTEEGSYIRIVKRDVELLKTAHVWNRFETFFYKEVPVFEPYTRVRSSGSSTVYERKIKEWVFDRKTVESNYEKFDETLTELKLGAASIKLLFESLQVNNIPLDGYSGKFLNLFSQSDMATMVPSPEDIPPVTEGTFMRPALGPITSSFGYRIHPISNKRKLHAGVDIGRNGSVTPIVASADGVVSRSAVSSSFGEVIYIKHNINGELWETVYAHMAPGSRRVQLGERVAKGQVIGIMGTTGNSTGVHLHFEVHLGGRGSGNPLNPVTSGIIEW